MKKLIGMVLILSLAGCGRGSSDPVPIGTGNTSTGGGSGGTVDDFKLTCEEARFIHLLNLYRVANGRVTLGVSKNAVIASRWHCSDMIEKNYFSHTEPNGRTFNARAAAFGYSAWAENIAGGYAHAEGTFCIWKNSSGHNSNMLNAGHRSTGIGVTNSVWSSNFGPAVNHQLSEPLTAAAGCPMPSVLPTCN